APRTQYAAGEVAALAGDREAARRHWEKATQGKDSFFRALPYQYLAAQRLGGADEAAGRAKLEAALADTQRFLQVGTSFPGLVAILLYIGNALTFLLGYWVFAVRWRRARISTVMEYLVERFDERTRQAFSWTTVLFQLFTGASMLYGLGLFVASTCSLPLVWTICGSGVVILAYCVIGGLWAVVITDFLQAVILMPFTVVMVLVSLSRVGGVGGLLRGLPPELTSLHLTPGQGWLYVACWTFMVSFGYYTSAMAQRYF